ncbi:hypothetical protein [Mycobacterium asiaticum]|nr:hypothetical protein [Mycobacterium asiaticum]
MKEKISTADAVREAIIRRPAGAAATARAASAFQGYEDAAWAAPAVHEAMRTTLHLLNGHGPGASRISALGANNTASGDVTGGSGGTGNGAGSVGGNGADANLIAGSGNPGTESHLDDITVQGGSGGGNGGNDVVTGTGDNGSEGDVIAFGGTLVENVPVGTDGASHPPS